jgi:hypothetical protein
MKRTLLIIFLSIISFELLAQTKSKPKSKTASNTSQVTKKSSVNYDVIDIQGYELADNAVNYIGKYILVDGFFSDAGNAGSWKDIQGMTLRSQGDEFEDIYAMINYSDNTTRVKGTYRRRVTIGGNKFNLIIPKSSSDNMPNTSSSKILISGTLTKYNTIEVSNIYRDY